MLLLERLDKMKGKTGNIIFGIILISLGVIAIGNQLSLWRVPIFFPGWWTLLIIVPFLINAIDSGITPMNLAGISFGILFLLSELNILSWKVIINSMVPILAVLIGIFLIFGRKNGRL